ncbi:Imm50 family immunity protein [Niveibacterium terrae]|uniref:Imm50 family immunity protein n=1 Tax=Niveibacterium terrae TaxID=3373598 RepID=UPI003A9130B3
MLKNSNAVTNHFGYWPEFCDARIESVSYALPGSVELTLFYIDASQRKSAHIALRFHGVTELKLNDLCNENVVDELIFEQGKVMTVSIVSAYGLFGRFSCVDAEVAYVELA